MTNQENDSHSKIMSAARKIFAREGFQGARIDEIAKEACVNKAMIYYHFHSKSELYQKVIDSFFAKDPNFTSLLDMPGLSSWQRLEKAINRISEVAENDKFDRCSIIAREMVSGTGVFQNMRDNYWIPDFILVRNILEKGILDGSFEISDPLDFIVFTIFSHIIFYKISEVTYTSSKIYESLYPVDNHEKMNQYLLRILKKMILKHV